MAYDQLVEEVRFRSGFDDRDDAERVTHVVLEVLGERLDDHASELVASRLPGRFGDRIRSSVHAGDFDLQGFYDRVASREGVREGFALEHAQVVCRAIAERLDDEARQHLRKELPEPFFALFEEPQPSSRPPPPRHHGAETEPRHGRTLATAKPRPAHPVSDDRTGGAHRDSVARTEAPHEQDKLSSSHGTSQERRHHTLSEGRGGSSRPVSESED